jgi:hypothetical protein
MKSKSKSTHIPKAAPSFIKKVQPSEASLEKIRARLREARSIEKQISSMSEDVDGLKKDLNSLRHETLPDMFIEVGIDNLGIPAEGNLPGYDFKLSPYYRANIGADWPSDRRQQAFDYLEKRGDGDLIKTTITVLLPRDQRKMSKKIEVFLRKLKVNYSVDLSVPWSTLTAYVKEQIEKNDAVLPLETLGAQVGNVVKMNERKN